MSNFRSAEKRRLETSKVTKKTFIYCGDDSGAISTLNQEDDAEFTLLQMQSPLNSFSKAEQCQKKVKMIRNAISNQMHRVIQGQILQAQKNAAVAVKAEKHVLGWAKKQELRQICLRCPNIQESPTQRFYRQKGEFMIQLENSLNNEQSNKVTLDNKENQAHFRIGSFYRIGGSDFRVFSADEMKESIIFPQIFHKILKIVENTLRNTISLQQIMEIISKATKSTPSYVIIKSTGHLEADNEQQALNIKNNSENHPQNNIQLNNNDEKSNIATTDGNNVQSEETQSIFVDQTKQIAKKYVVDEVLVTLQFQGQLETFSEDTQLLQLLKQNTASLSAQEGIKITYEMQGDNLSLQQKIGRVSVRVSAASFCQVNLAVQELILCDVVQITLATLKLNDQNNIQTIKIADLCCGAGIIGQYIAAELLHYFKSNRKQDINLKIIGVEIVPEAVQAAEAAARENGLADVCSYICDPIEACKELLDDLDVAVLDPPRSGAHPSVLTALRKSTLQTLIYISCNPKSLAQALYTLCSYDKHQTVPFYVTQIKAFDMFPGCAHVETLVVLQRAKNANGEI